MTANADLFAVCDPAFETSGAVCLANELARLVVVSNLIVYFRPGQTARLRACSDGDSLYRRYRHHCLREQPVELEIPGRVRTQSRHHAARHNLKNTAERVACLSSHIDELDHSLLRLIVSTVQRGIVGDGGNLF